MVKNMKIIIILIWVELLFSTMVNLLSPPTMAQQPGLVYLQEGTSNYFKGLMLILCYLIVAASFFVHVDPLDVK